MHFCFDFLLSLPSYSSTTLTRTSLSILVRVIGILASTGRRKEGAKHTASLLKETENFLAKCVDNATCCHNNEERKKERKRLIVIVNERTQQNVYCGFLYRLVGPPFVSTAHFLILQCQLLSCGWLFFVVIVIMTTSSPSHLFLSPSLSSSLIPIIPPSTPSHLLLLSFLVDHKETQHQKQSQKTPTKTITQKHSQNSQSQKAHSQKSHKNTPKPLMNKNTPKPLMNKNTHKNTKNTQIH